MGIFELGPGGSTFWILLGVWEMGRSCLLKPAGEFGIRCCSIYHHLPDKLTVQIPDPKTRVPISAACILLGKLVEATRRITISASSQTTCGRGFPNYQYSEYIHSTRYFKYIPDPWADPKSRCTLGFCNLHHRSGISNEWILVNRTNAQGAKLEPYAYVRLNPKAGGARRALQTPGQIQEVDPA